MHDTRRTTSIHHLISKRYTESFDTPLALLRPQGNNPVGETAEQPPRLEPLIVAMDPFYFIFSGCATASRMGLSK
jgi:hypothetical protein